MSTCGCSCYFCVDPEKIIQHLNPFVLNRHRRRLPSFCPFRCLGKFTPPACLKQTRSARPCPSTRVHSIKKTQNSNETRVGRNQRKEADRALPSAMLATVIDAQRQGHQNQKMEGDSIVQRAKSSLRTNHVGRVRFSTRRLPIALKDILIGSWSHSHPGLLSCRKIPAFFFGWGLHRTKWHGRAGAERARI